MDRKLRLLYEKMWVEEDCNLKPVNKNIDYDPEQLKMGIEIEKEHTDDIQMAETIAKQHLEEDPKYYTKLKKMESGEPITEGKSGHGDEKAVRQLLKDAIKKGLVTVKETNSGWLVKSTKDNTQEAIHKGERAFHYLRRYLQKLGY